MSTQFEYNPELILSALPQVAPETQEPLLDHLGAGAVFQALIDSGSGLAARDNVVSLAVYKGVTEDLQDRKVGSYYLLHETILTAIINRAVRQGMAQSVLDIAQQLADSQIAEGWRSILHEAAPHEPEEDA